VDSPIRAERLEFGELVESKKEPRGAHWPINDSGDIARSSNKATEGGSCWELNEQPKENDENKKKGSNELGEVNYEKMISELKQVLKSNERNYKYNTRRTLKESEEPRKPVETKMKVQDGANPADEAKEKEVSTSSRSKHQILNRLYDHQLNRNANKASYMGT
jgi:hypothetical protein